MSDNVVYLNNTTTLDIPASRVIEGATAAELEQAVVVGVTQDGALYFASSQGRPADTMWLLELAKQTLLESCE